MDNKTSINNEIDENNLTEINSNILKEDLIDNENSTVLNQSVSHFENGFEKGEILCGKYEVIEKLEIEAGEADLYICSYEDKKYVAKLYKRKIAIKSEIVEKLKNIDSNYIAEIYETDTYNGYPFEILPYYQNGSIQGKKYDFHYLKKYVIPCLNEGLKILHENGIIHKDLKPSNIMITDNPDEFAIIDFGISSIMNGENTVVVTHTGMTPAYSAPETFRNVYLEESDYYSLGITIYELFCGYTPYSNMNSEEIAQYVSIQKIPFNHNMAPALENLISALTYYDITNRKDKNNPNRRWTYEEVKKWCNGEKIPIPGNINSNNNSKIKLYRFMYKDFTDIHELIKAFAQNWESGKKDLFRGLLSSYFKTTDQSRANFCIDAEEEMQKTNDEDYVFFKLLYKLDLELEGFYWINNKFESLKHLGLDIFERLNKNDLSNTEFYDTILEKGLLSHYMYTRKTFDLDLCKTVKSIEEKFKNPIYKRDKIINYYHIAYILMERKILKIGELEFKTLEEIVSHMYNLLYNSYDVFEEFCKKLIGIDKILDIQFEAWLISMGKEDELDKWKVELNVYAEEDKIIKAEKEAFERAEKERLAREQQQKQQEQQQKEQQQKTNV